MIIKAEVLIIIFIPLAMVPPIVVRSLVSVTNIHFVFSVFNMKRLFQDQMIGGIVSKETVCCVGGKVKH